MHDTNLEENLQALVDSRTRQVPSPALRRLATSTDRSAIEPEHSNPATMEESSTKKSDPAAEPDFVNHPPHYTAHPSGVECITITEWMNFNLGNAVKYIWRSSDKGATIEDLKKARWYLDREIARLEKLSG